MSPAICLFALALVLRGSEPADPLTVYKSGDYASAIPLLQQAVAKDSKSAVLRAALLSALVYQGRVDEAADAANEDAQAFPQSPEILAARGEFAFYMSDLPAAESLYKAAAKLKDETARAYYGLYRLYYAASMYRTARLFCLRAHAMDPDDSLITLAFMRYLTPEKRREELPPFIQSHPWFYRHLAQAQETGTDLRGQLDKRKPFELDGPREETTLPLLYLHDGPRVVGVGVRMSIEGGKNLTLMLDTGASGLLLTQAAIDKAGLNHVGSIEIGGIGDKGRRSGFLAVAETCS